MQNSVDHYFNSLEEPFRSCLLYLRTFLLGFSDEISEKRSNNTPFYYYRKKSIGFISYDPKTKDIYFSFTNGHKIEHPKLASEGRRKMKIFKVDPEKDVDIDNLREILNSALGLN
ncbi:hypothetical protein CNR22_06820 [Sphingobacteriaceae bacterium]|nr:hypothetical protein CNR22_06820 [Sphingobacteriaceae bacterium]